MSHPYCARAAAQQARRCRSCAAAPDGTTLFCGLTTARVIRPVRRQSRDRYALASLIQCCSLMRGTTDLRPVVSFHGISKTMSTLQRHQAACLSLQNLLEGRRVLARIFATSRRLHSQRRLLLQLTQSNEFVTAEKLGFRRPMIASVR